MAGEHIDKCNVPEKEIKFGSLDTHTMQRSRSLNELPGHHRVTILKRQDTERTKARLEAVAAGMEELKHLRKQHQQRMEETLCESSKKQQDHTTELVHRHRPNERHRTSMPSFYQERNHKYARDYPENNVAHDKSKHQRNNPQRDLDHKRNPSQSPVESLRQNRTDTQNNARQYNTNSDIVTPQTNRPQEIQKVCDFDHRQGKHQDAPMEYARTQNDDQLRSRKQQNEYMHSVVCVQSEPKVRVSNNQTAARKERTSSQDYLNSQNNNRCQNVTFQDCSIVSNDSRQRSANISDYSQQRGHNKPFYPTTAPISHSKERCSSLNKSVNQMKEHTSNVPIIQTPTNFSSTSSWSEEDRRATIYTSSSHRSPNLNRQIKTSVSLSPQRKYASNKVCGDNTCGDNNCGGNTCGNNNCGVKLKEPNTFHKAQNLDASGTRDHCHVVLSVNESDPNHQNKRAPIKQMAHYDDNSASIARHKDYDHKLSQFLMQQSNQRFSRGRTQSVHENFYYFPTRTDNSNISTNQKDDSKVIKRASPQQYNTDNLNSRSLQNNCVNSDCVLSVPSEANKNSKLSEQRFLNTSSSHKSFSWEELLVAVGLSKKETQINRENSRESIFNDTIDLDDCQSKLTTTGTSTNTNTLEDVKKNDDESRSSYKLGLAKPYRSQSFSIQVEPSRNVQYPDEVHLQSKPIFNWIGISRHPSLSTISSKILNPLHEVDLRSMNQPGPVHAVTLQYAGLTTRHMSLGTIPSISHTNCRNEELHSTMQKSDLTGKAHLAFEMFKLQKDSPISKVSHPEPRHSFNPKDLRLSGNRSHDVDLKTQPLHDLQTSSCLMNNKPNTMLSVPFDDINSPTSVAQTRSHNATSTFSPKMSPIKTIVEDCEDVFENCLQLITPLIKPRSLSDTADTSKCRNQHNASSILKTSAHLSDSRQETTEMKIVTVIDVSMLAGVPTDSNSSNRADVESMYSDFRSSSSNSATLTLNAGDVVVVEGTASQKTKADTQSRDNNSVSSGTLKIDSAYSNNSFQELEQSQSELSKSQTDPGLFSTLDGNTDTSCGKECKPHILVNSNVFQQTPSELFTQVSCSVMTPANVQSFHNIVTSRSTERIDDATTIMNEQTRNPISDQTDTDKESLALEKTKQGQCDIKLLSPPKKRQPFKQTDV
ncbi:uncharacterized protein LOC106058390 [Biomphalaria glabrata]|uniref:Uncharacterized protein LOC106058390 n=1 Tax=Biomphalaria glabrata TaxID=6526 RepID=A0A9U8E3K4_BIOGL|nr:uncharacterized protein LOC106058390 [Biomphalaria glabrata]XP_013071276.2 uncharacterized protein LOC106058390 [Biomphalaria glabrata]XP_055885151.1 uncharacterized protein LOC106058390 [Biomphalaria glabrata]XP_055885152.1 uncharacterized protein LOC106058390 [Biomphalaria glabrata]XP_055885154.1 uncharacterized protein LOC106058390 [Biomphalaria glabrata]